MVALGWAVALALAVGLGTALGRVDGAGAGRAPAASGIDARPGAAADVRPPNIVFVLTDDMDSGQVSFMPRLGSLLVDQGMSFTHYYVTDSLCCPSRTSILVGQYLHNHKVLRNWLPDGGFETFHRRGLEGSTIGALLQRAGYRTAMFGKFLNGYPNTVAPTYIPAGWDEWDVPTGMSAYQEFEYQLNENGKLVSYGSRPEDYLTDVIARKSAAFIRESARLGKPFFAYVSTYAPHQPAVPAPRHANLFAGLKLPRPASFDEADVSDKPSFVRKLPRLTEPHEHMMHTLYLGRLRSLQAVDEMLEQLVQAVTETGTLDNTYFVFTSDNGFHLGQHRLPAGKGTAYEEDVRVPLVIRGPGVPRGQTRDDLAVEIDLAPTFATWAGLAVPRSMDGRPLQPLLGPAPPPAGSWRKAILFEHLGPVDEPFERPPRPRAKHQIPEHTAIRTADEVFIHYATGDRELYNVTADPYELNNLVRSQPATAARLGVALLSLLRCAGETCRAAEDLIPIPPPRR